MATARPPLVRLLFQLHITNLRVDDGWDIEIDAGHRIHAVAFSANGEYLVSGGFKIVQVWRVKDGEQVAVMKAESGISRISVSKDARWIATGSWWGEVSVWDTTTHERAFARKIGSFIYDIDLSPESARLVTVDSPSAAAVIWDIQVGHSVRTIDQATVFAAKYSLQGDRIAVACSHGYVRVWDSNNGRPLVNVNVSASLDGLFWLNDHLLVKTKDNKILQINATNGSTISEWSVPHSDFQSCVALPRHGKYVAYSAKKAITFWDTSTHNQLGLIPQNRDVCSVACSPDGQLLVIVAERKIIIKAAPIISSFALDPEIHIEDTTLRSASHRVRAVAFTANSEYLVSGGFKVVQVWRLRDGKQVAAMEVGNGGATSISVSKDDRWIAAGSWWGEVLVWDATTYERVFAHKIGSFVYDIDFSPNSTRIITVDSPNSAAIIWDFQARQKLRTIDQASVYAAKYSPQGDRIAVACSHGYVRVWDSSNGRPLVNVNINASFNGLLWLNDHLLVKTNDRKIKEIDTTIGSTVSERSVPYSDYWSCIALPQHGRFVAYSAKKSITFWDTSTHEKLCLMPESPEECLIAFSPDGQLLAVAGNGGKITVRSLSFFTGPEIPIHSTALDAWRCGRLTDAEELLTALIPTSHDTAHHVLASRALVRARLRQWDRALDDAEESIRIRPSIIGYIAKYVALVNTGDKHGGDRVGQVASQHFYSDLVTFRLVKAIVLFMTGDHVSGISRIENLIYGAFFHSTFYVVQAYMHFLLGGLCMERGDYRRAVRLFEDAKVKLGNRTHLPPLIVSLISGWKFDNLATTIQQSLCEALFSAGRTEEAGKCVLPIAGQEDMTEPMKVWVSDFKSRCHRKLEDDGDSAVNEEKHDVAISLYSVALLLNPPTLQDLLVKRSKAYASKGSWEDALNDADNLITVDPSSPLGYQRKHETLRAAGRYVDAVETLERLLYEMSRSSDPQTREQSRQYVKPAQIKATIRTAIQNAIQNSPLVLIDTISGQLCDKAEQAAAFESTPTFAEFSSSMTTHIDRARIEQEVEEFYRYATLSHTWEGNEPLYQRVVRIVVYDLEASATHHKLQMFCKIAREEGFKWAWSDTCCIDKADHFVLQEALVSMFKWYEGSALTIIFLCDVERLAGPGALMMSLWNMRGWTLQEYHASKVARIYTKDWTPYLGLTIYNHKESPEVISEMEQATGISAQALTALRPGLNDIQEKLRLASTRQTTRVEDAAYSLLGIFSIPLPVTYGEGDKALGRLLSQLLMSSGNTSILSWTGTSGSFNSCLPANIAVFSQSSTSHIPPAIPSAEMETIITDLRTSSLELTLLTGLYERLNGLPTPIFVGQRMRVPCLAFETVIVSEDHWDGSEFVFRAQATVLGVIEIRSKKDLLQLDSLHLIHPWIDFLLDRHPVTSTVETRPEDQPRRPRVRPSLPAVPSASSADRPSLSTPSIVSSPETPTHIYEFLARLRRPFGALLLTPTRRNVAEYRRVTSEDLITVQIKEMTSEALNELMQSVRLLDVL